MDFNQLTSYLDSLEDRFGIPFSDCAVTYRHEVVFRHMTGHWDEARRLPTNTAVLYRLFSATKPITCAAVLQLAERGRLDLYDPLARYLPEFSLLRVADHWDGAPGHWPPMDAPCRLARGPVRLIDLLTMTAGLSYDTTARSILEMRRRTGGAGDTRAAVAALARMPLLYEPGTHWAYSLAHDVLAAVVEVVSGQKFSEYLREHIFAPLDAADFCFCPDVAMAARVGRLYQKDRRTGAIVDDDGVYSGAFSFTARHESGGAGLIATVDAYSKVADALCCGGVGYNGARILRPETVTLFTVPYTVGALQEDFVAFRRGCRDYAYGLGVRVRTGAGRPPLGEFGWDGAAGAYVAMDCKNALSIVYAQHVLGCLDAFDSIHPTIRDLVYEALEL